MAASNYGKFLAAADTPDTTINMLYLYKQILICE